MNASSDGSTTLFVLLGRIADRTLDDATRREAVLVEATLRDSIRAKALDVPDIAQAARAARERGVTVHLLDDGGLGPYETAVADEIRGAIVGHLRCATSGSITVRILPAGRPTLAAVVVQSGDHTERYEFPAPTGEQAHTLFHGLRRGVGRSHS
ncbi:hypothetical protein [Rhodococcoides kyotonense]|uniref:Uncharacterized protein n=1 Tax=Rhodococcoides kyotonense TaxID=398843 RepID=A0A177Y7L1_9NOCA|nr:hypothetical protein [Rhodococcus kyotonensis]OAK51483.1 hypothetical protein A3K89_11075 [Rhodococcus kyotonensis]